MFEIYLPSRCFVVKFYVLSLVLTRSHGNSLVSREPKSLSLYLYLYIYIYIGDLISFLSNIQTSLCRRLDLYPNGNEEENGADHISLYVIICGTESLPKGWEVYVDVNFFIYDHMQHKYASFQGNFFSFRITSFC